LGYFGISWIVRSSVCDWLLGIAMKTLPVCTAYAVWVGIGPIGMAILGILLFSESASFGRLFSLFLIFAGIIGLKLFTT